MDAAGDVEVRLARLEDRPEPDLGDAGANDLGAFGTFEAREQPAGGQFELAGVTGVAGRMEGFHGAVLTALMAAAVQVRFAADDTVAFASSVDGQRDPSRSALVRRLFRRLSTATPSPNRRGPVGEPLRPVSPRLPPTLPVTIASSTREYLNVASKASINLVLLKGRIIETLALLEAP
ncbi:hypothetical protein [Pinisolibacter sp.]|uniref:hypothetical protein n=1 Tax=Pinisolibacter sp. TaxID=2172024 RepID=UPI002FDDAA06